MMNKKAEIGLAVVMFILLLAIMSLIAVGQYYDTTRAIKLAQSLKLEEPNVCIQGCKAMSPELNYNASISDLEAFSQCSILCHSKYD